MDPGMATDVTDSNSSPKEKGKKHKKNKKNKKESYMENNDTVHGDEKGTCSMENTPLDRGSHLEPPANNSSKVDLPVKEKKRKKGKRAVALKDGDLGRDHSEGTSIKNIPPENLNVQPLVNTQNTDIARSKAEASSSSKRRKGKKLKGGQVPGPDLVVGHSGKEDKSFVSGTDSIKNHDDTADNDVVSLNLRNDIKSKKKTEVKIYRRRNAKLSHSYGDISESIKDDGMSFSMEVVQNNSAKKFSSKHSDNEIGSTLSENKLERLPVEENSTSVQPPEYFAEKPALTNCSYGKPASEESKKTVEMNPKEATCEDSCVKNGPVQVLPEELSEPMNGVKLDKTKMVRAHVEGSKGEPISYCKDKGADDISACNSSCEHLELTNVEEETEVKEIIPSSSHLSVIKSDFELGTNQEENPPQTSQSPPERALICHPRKKLLILDVNGLLADIVLYPKEGYMADAIISKKSVFKRPFCNDFLKFCFERFDVGVWSSRTKRNVDRVLDFLMADSRHKLLFCWDQSQCTDTGFATHDNVKKPLLLKELRKLWEKHEPDLPWEKGDYNESNTLLLDDSPYKALLNPAHTAIFPYSYEYKDAKDTLLGPRGKLRNYVEGLAMSDNVQNYVKQNPFGQRAITKSSATWSYYGQVVRKYSSKQEEYARNYSACQQ